MVIRSGNRGRTEDQMDLLGTVYRLVKPALFALPPEVAHETTLRGLRTCEGTRIEDEIRARLTLRDDRLRTHVFGCEFPNPVCVAAGFDKNARVPGMLSALGFGGIEVGGVTAEPQVGNTRPRLFRLADERALINRLGFNNEGADVIGRRLDRESLPSVPIGVNIGKSKRTPLTDAPADYRYTYERVSEAADYVTVNVSSPNTPGLRSLQHRDALESILGELLDAGADPLLVKLSPDLEEEAIKEALVVVDELDIDGVIAVNTTTERPESVSDPRRAERGGLSGKPIEARATRLVRFVAQRTDVPVVGVGGVSDATGAYRKIRAGASIVQLYTGLVFEGPSLARSINRGLLACLERDGFDSIEEAVGADLEDTAPGTGDS